MRKIAIVLLSILFCLGCSNNNERTETADEKLVFDGLVGVWKLNEEEQFEEWKWHEDGSYSSRAYTVADKDTNVMEEVKVINEGGKWNFITQVKGQNKGKAVTFTSTILQDTLVQFENPAHDFPRMINYRLASKNVMQAFIGGTTDTIYFNFSRVISK